MQFVVVLKDSMFLTWAKQHCSVSFVFKGDDDIFINPFQLEELILTDGSINYRRQSSALIFDTLLMPDGRKFPNLNYNYVFITKCCLIDTR